MPQKLEVEVFLRRIGQWILNGRFSSDYFIGDCVYLKSIGGMVVLTWK